MAAARASLFSCSCFFSSVDRPSFSSPAPPSLLRRASQQGEEQRAAPGRKRSQKLSRKSIVRTTNPSSNLHTEFGCKNPHGLRANWEKSRRKPHSLHILVTDATDPVAERAEWGLDEKTRVVPFVWLREWSQQDVPLPETYEQAASVGEGAPRLAPAA